MNSSSMSTRHAAEAEEAVGEAGAGDAVQDIQDDFPVVEAIQDRGEGPQVHEVGAHPQEVGGDAVQLGR